MRFSNGQLMTKARPTTSDSGPRGLTKTVTYSCSSPAATLAGDWSVEKNMPGLQAPSAALSVVL